MPQLTPIVQSIFADFSRGDVAAIVARFHDDIRFYHPGGPTVPYAKDRRGKAAAAAFFSDLAAAVEVTAFQPQSYVEQGDTVIAFGRWAARSRANGRAFETDWAMRWTFDGDKVKDYREYDDTATLARAFGG